MTREEIMALSGRELDAAVAEHVMGWRPRWVEEPPYWMAWEVELPNGDMLYGTIVSKAVPQPAWYDDRDGVRCPRFSTDIDAAWEVVERLTELVIDEIDLTVEVKNGVEIRNVAEGWLCSIYCGCEQLVETRAQSAPEAICRAALLAALKRSEAKNGGGEA